MKRRTRIRYTDSQKAVMWDRWQQGESLHHGCLIDIIRRFAGFWPGPAVSVRQLDLGLHER